MIVIITMLAFIINVGLFVKAKINLQNAVDSAAFSGAAVQARQLSTIGYLNWELRNTYKEWLFKYYVLGQLAQNKTKLDSNGELPMTGRHKQWVAGKMNFRQDPFDVNGVLGMHDGTPDVDPYNAPSICIHFGKDDICQIYKVPGLPRFDPVGLPGIGEHHEAFMNVLDQQKSTDCSKRSALNFMTALMWTYGTGKDIPGGTAIAVDRPGAWVQSMELALRIRNMEYIVNAPPISKICLNASGCTNPETLKGSGGPRHERSYKAFQSGMRNLGSELQETFALSELSPTPFVPEASSLSGSLYPSGSSIEKYYLDLKVIPINYVIFYTTFVSLPGAYAGNVQATAQCDSSKTALPVPGYITAFVKNPNMLTYYAVKGEARFMGLFFPFASDGILLKAYAAAKPFGGRIGPYLFLPNEGNQTVGIRTGGNNRSLSYISSLIPKTGLPANTNFLRGYPIPLMSDYWVKGPVDVLGGVPDVNNHPAFGIPNLTYDFDSDLSELQASSSDVFLRLNPATTVAQGIQNVEEKPIGLYSSKQFLAFAKNLGYVPSNATISPDEIKKAIEKARRPTKYEALNYLVPTCFKNSVADSGNDFEALPTVPEVCSSADDTKPLQIYAPLFGDGLLYPGSPEAKEAIMSYIRGMDAPIKQFLEALKGVADSVKLLNQGNVGGAQNSADAAKLISTNDPSSECNGTTVTTAQGLSMAGRFYYFFNGNGTNCEIVSLKDSIEKFWDTQRTRNALFDSYYLTTFTPPEEGSDQMSDFMTAFMPGQRHGTNDDGTRENPLSDARSARRNYYSTKFVAVDKLLSSSTFPNLRSYVEGGAYKEKSYIGDSPVDMSDTTLQNPLNRSELSEFGPIDH